MGHLINPVTYRLGKTKFWSSIWSNKSRKNYKKNLFEDLNFYKFLNWVLSVLSWNKVGIFVSNYTLIKSFKSINVSLFFFINKLRLLSNYKKYFFKFLFKTNFLNFFFKILLNKKFLSFRSFFFLKKYKFNFFFSKKQKKNIFYKKKKIFKTFSKFSLGIKKKKKNLRKRWLNSFLFKFCFFSLKNLKKFKKQHLILFNSYFLNKSISRNSFLFNSSKQQNIIQKNSVSRVLNYKFFFNVLSFFLSFFLKKIFGHKNVFFNFFKKNKIFYNALSIKDFIDFNMGKNRSKVTQVVKKVFKKSRKKYYILGLKIGFFGRYEKKLRNKSVWQSRGSLSPSNINTPIMQKNFCILLKQGLCGVKISFLTKLKKNEIFKKKTFINKSF